MAEGGIAAALANVDDRDNWKVHFADTMRGGQYVNNWRMAELHAKEAPDRVRELEAWGAVFDRTKDGRILQRNFGGHKYPRLAHVGDRTGLEMIRTLQDHGDASRNRRVHGDLHRRVAERWRPRHRRLRIRSRTRSVQSFSRQSSYSRHRRNWQSLQDYEQQLGLHRRRAFTRVSCRRGVDRHGVHSISSHRHGLAAERRGNARDRRRARRRRHPHERRRQTFHVRFHSRQLQSADRR